MDADGVTIERTAGVRAGVWTVAGVLVLLGVALLVLRRAPRSEGPAAATGARSEPVRAAVARSQRGEPPPGERRAEAAPVRMAPPVAPARVIDLPARSRERDVSDDEPAAAPGAPAAASAPSGIALFPPMGTDPLKRGILVPDDFELPPGYVRHHQVTDDGEPLPPILMFHPDFTPIDADGRPLAVPADRVVPPEMAPSGLEIRLLDVPEQGDPAARIVGDTTAPE